MDELQAGVVLILAVLPQAPILIQSGKFELYDPALEYHLERVQLTALGDLHRDAAYASLLRLKRIVGV